MRSLEIALRRHRSEENPLYRTGPMSDRCNGRGALPPHRQGHTQPACYSVEVSNPQVDLPVSWPMRTSYLVSTVKRPMLAVRE